MKTESVKLQLSPIWVRLKLLIENKVENGEVSMPADEFEVKYHFRGVTKMISLETGARCNY